MAMFRGHGSVLCSLVVLLGGAHHQKLVVVRWADDPDARHRVRRGHGPRDRPAATTPITAATHRLPTSPRRTTARPRPGTTCRSGLKGRRSTTSRSPSGNGGTTRRPSTAEPPCEDCCTGRRSTRSSRVHFPLSALRHPTSARAIQVLRTYPARRSPYPFAPQGERSIARAYIKAFRRASRLVYLEDQYLWSFRAADELCAALRREPDLLVAIVIPRYPDPDGRVAGTASSLGREEVQHALYEAGGDRVAVFDVENDHGTPIYVHSKACIVDDVWCAVGSDNLNRRSWTHDSEISCAVLDGRLDERAPQEMGSHGDRARMLPRDTRLRLTCEHAGLDPDAADTIVDPKEWFDLLRLRADALDAWHEHGRVGPRPPGHLRRHAQEHTSPPERRLLHWVHAGPARSRRATRRAPGRRPVLRCVSEVRMRTSETHLNRGA